MTLGPEKLAQESLHIQSKSDNQSHQQGCRYSNVILFCCVSATFLVSIAQFYFVSLFGNKNYTSTADFIHVASISKQQLEKQKELNIQYNEKLNDSSPQLPAYHILFSTSCTDQQNWESWVFFFHCHRVGQRGNITRIVSGCDEKQVDDLNNFHQQYVVPSFGSNYHIHFTPDYSRVALSNGKFPYKYMNKPYGLQDWLRNGPLSFKDYSKLSIENDVPDSVLDGIIFLLDPDMILLRPLTHDFSNEEVIFVQNENEIASKIVKHGYPIAQQDGYLSSEWMRLNFTSIFEGSEGYVPPPSSIKDGSIFWNTGPPYIATVKDMHNIANLWSELTPKVLHIFPQLFAEMYGFIIATLQLNLPHTMIKSLVVSTTETRDREGWAFIDALPDNNELCSVANKVVTQTASEISSNPPLPVGLHYCKRYSLRRNFFSKYRIKKNIMRCDKNLLHVVRSLDTFYPADEYYSISPPRADGSDAKSWKEVPANSFGEKTAKREAFMLCSLTAAVTEALRFLKLNTSACTTGVPANINEIYTVYDDPSDY